MKKLRIVVSPLDYDNQMGVAWSFGGRRNGLTFPARGFDRDAAIRLTMAKFWRFLEAA